MFVSLFERHTSGSGSLNLDIFLEVSAQELNNPNLRTAYHSDDSDEDMEEGLVFPRTDSDGKLKLLEELCTRKEGHVSVGHVSPAASASASASASSSQSKPQSAIFPPDYLDKYIKEDGDFKREEWVRTVSEEELQRKRCKR